MKGNGKTVVRMAEELSEESMGPMYRPILITERPKEKDFISIQTDHSIQDNSKMLITTEKAFSITK